MFVTFALALLGVFVVGLIVFGGGQVFMPIFESLWKLLEQGSDSSLLTSETYQNVFTVANFTPGVVSTKLAAITAILVADGQWWGYLALILTYLVFVIPGILMMYWATLGFEKIVKKYLQKSIAYFKPIIIGILAALVLQLFLGTVFFHFSFNASFKEYITYKVAKKAEFFKNWRLYVLYFWVPFEIIATIYLYWKKVNLFLIILLMVGLAMIVFEPWLN